jgi:pimeloyl-ACP methyl ester carboxylesterase
MGGHSTVCAAALHPQIYSRLALIDPTIYPPEAYGTPPVDASYIRKRKNEFHSAEEMIERFRNKPPFSRWNPLVLRDYCEWGVLPKGGPNSRCFALACPPEIEASIYEEAKLEDTNIYPEIALVRQPVTVIRAGRARTPGVFDLSTSPTAVNLASYFADARDMVFEECTHYIPQEAPGRVAEEIRSLG